MPSPTTPKPPSTKGDRVHDPVAASSVLRHPCLAMYKECLFGEQCHYAKYSRKACLNTIKGKRCKKWCKQDHRPEQVFKCPSCEEGFDRDSQRKFERYHECTVPDGGALGAPAPLTSSSSSSVSTQPVPVASSTSSSTTTKPLTSSTTSDANNVAIPSPSNPKKKANSKSGPPTTSSTRSGEGKSLATPYLSHPCKAIYGQCWNEQKCFYRNFPQDACLNVIKNNNCTRQNCHATHDPSRVFRCPKCEERFNFSTKSQLVQHCCPIEHGWTRRKDGGWQAKVKDCCPELLTELREKREQERQSPTTAAPGGCAGSSCCTIGQMSPGSSAPSSPANTDTLSVDYATTLGMAKVQLPLTTVEGADLLEVKADDLVCVCQDLSVVCDTQGKECLCDATDEAQAATCPKHGSASTANNNNNTSASTPPAATAISISTTTTAGLLPTASSGCRESPCRGPNSGCCTPVAVEMKCYFTTSADEE